MPIDVGCRIQMGPVGLHRLHVVLPNIPDVDSAVSIACSELVWIKSVALQVFDLLSARIKYKNALLIFDVPQNDLLVD